jgi:citryl-CoA lyase
VADQLQQGKSSVTEKNTPGFWVTSVSDVTPEDVYIRGYALRSIMGELPFPAAVSLLIRGKVPTPGEARMMDIILCGILDYALQKAGTVAARCVVSVNPQMAPGLAAAVLAAGEYALSPEDTGRFLIENYSAWKASGEPLEQHATRFVEGLRAQKKRVPGFGHPVFRGVDPRAQKLREAAIANGVWGPLGTWYEAVHRAFRIAANKPDLVINDVGMIACLLAEMGYTPQEMAGIAILSTIPGLIAHISEELASGVRGRLVPDGSAHYARDRHDLAKDMEAAGWT